MKAVAISSKSRNIEVLHVPEPDAIGPDQVLAEPLRVGLCGTDKEIVEQGYGHAPEGEDFLILGHECLARIVATGSEVQRLQAGQLVVPRVRRPCQSPACAACRGGRPDFCLTGQYTERGIKGYHGFLCQQFIDYEQYFHVVPDELDTLGVLTEPLTIAMKALIQIGDVQDRLPYVNRRELDLGNLHGTTAVVLGAGPVGLLGALALQNAGSQVYVYSAVEEPNPASTVIEKTGVQYVSSSTVDPDQFHEMTGPVQIIYEATGASQFAFDMTRLLGPNGIYVLTGVPGRKGPVKIDADRIMRNMVLQNQLIIGTVNAGPPAFEAAIATLRELNKRWPGVLAGLITSEILPEEVNETMKTRKRGIKTVVKFQ